MKKEKLQIVVLKMEVEIRRGKDGCGDDRAGL